MYTKINKPEGHNENKGSCKAIIEYLEKENDDLKLSERQGFFNQDRDHISAFEAENMIDKNIAKLGKKDSKFFHISINPSSRELQHIASKVAGKKITNLDQLKPNQIVNFERHLKEYTNNVMDGYARNFNRGLEGKDLVYVAKVETTRKYDRFSKEVEHNRIVKRTGQGEYMLNSNGDIIKDGMKKEGMQHHIHVVVSRKDVTNKIKLSPFANARNAKNKLDGKEVQIGFDRKAFVNESEKRFDHQFTYNRDYKNSFEYKYAMSKSMQYQYKSAAKQLIHKNLGNPKQELLKELGLDKGKQLSDQTKMIRNILTKGISPHQIALNVAKKVVQNVLQL